MERARAYDNFYRAPRVPIDSGVVLLRGGRELTAKSINISNSGILLESVLPLRIGEFLVIEMGRRSEFGFRMVNFGLVVRKMEGDDKYEYAMSFVESPPVSHCMTTDLSYQEFLEPPHED